MTESDRLEFAKQILYAGEAFGEPVNELRAAAYFDALYDLNLVEIRAAIRHLVRESRFFPRPVDIRGVARGTADQLADEAWAKRDEHPDVLAKLGISRYDLRRMDVRDVMRLREPFRQLFKRSLEVERFEKLLGTPMQTRILTEGHASLASSPIDSKLRP